jgi:hypothetical protein
MKPSGEIIHHRRCVHLCWITSLRSLFLRESRLFCALLLHGGGAREATLSLWPCLRSSDHEGPGPPACLGMDPDLSGMKVLKAAERAFASLNFPTTPPPRCQRVQRARPANRGERPSLSPQCRPVLTTDASPWPPSPPSTGGWQGWSSRRVDACPDTR